MLEQPALQTEQVTIEEPLRESVVSLSVELTRISEEIKSIDCGFHDGLQQALAETQAAMETRFTTQLQQLGAELERYRAHAETVNREIERASKEFDVISAEIVMLIDDSSVQLGALMRKRGEAAGLRSYLAGLRFLAGPNSRSRWAASS